mmetsp:Transcript_178527/g.566513  ORF Transcript_178527/g.566513 Transcript_178527/m.566513 type:complete len:437 (-) Transcript_178527:223-1533(-)
MGASATSGCTGAGSDDEGGKSIWDTYEVGEKLGSGNFGEVRACRRRKVARDGADDSLAVKIVDRQSKQVQAAEAFHAARMELDIMTGLSHPNVVELKEIFEDNRFLYVVMELVPGGELFKVISDRRAVVWEEDIASIGLQILEALEYLHGIGIVHRDIKAQNLLLTEAPQVPGRALQKAEVKLIDFGLATRLRQECLTTQETQLNVVCGTPAMCAPEIWAAQSTAPSAWKQQWGCMYGPKVDIFALGVVLYTALLGKLPFMERQAARLAAKVCDPDEKPAFESKSGHRVSSGCQKFLGSLLEKDQTKRPSAAAARQDGWLGGRGSKKARTRGLTLAPIPIDVREAAAVEVEAALLLRFEEDGEEVAELATPGVSAEEAEERSRALEGLRAEAASQLASARLRPLPRHGDAAAAMSSGSEDSVEESEDDEGSGAFAC